MEESSSPFLARRKQTKMQKTFHPDIKCISEDQGSTLNIQRLSSVARRLFPSPGLDFVGSRWPPEHTRSTVHQILSGLSSAHLT